MGFYCLVCVFRPPPGLPWRLSHPHGDRLGQAVAEGAAWSAHDVHTLQRLPARSWWEELSHKGVAFFSFTYVRLCVSIGCKKILYYIFPGIKFEKNKHFKNVIADIDELCIMYSPHSTDLPEKQEQLHAIYKVLEELPPANFNTLERLIFHLVRSLFSHRSLFSGCSVYSSQACLVYLCNVESYKKWKKDAR